MNGDRGEIARLAYAIWEREGRPQGRDHQHWLAAEAELATMTAAGAPAKPRKPRAPRAPKAASDAALAKRAPRKPKTTS